MSSFAVTFAFLGFLLILASEIGGVFRAIASRIKYGKVVPNVAAIAPKPATDSAAEKEVYTYDINAARAAYRPTDDRATDSAAEKDTVK
jgi:hypothetical protein